MAVSIFDGIGRIITLASGIPISSGTNFTDAESEMYSEWKRWAKLSDNAKFAPAFRTIGGDPLGAGVDAGAFFFLQNQARTVSEGGWVIKPPEQSGIFEIVGNVFAENSDNTVFSGTAGAFTTQIRLTTSSLTQQVNVNEILSILSESALTTATFDSAVTIDSINGVAGTAFPIGNTTNPVNNIVDALSIATSLNLRKYKIINDLTISGTHTNWTFAGEGDHTPVTLVSGSDFSNSIFLNAELNGDVSGNTIDAIGSVLAGLSNFCGHFQDCGLEDINTIATGDSIFSNCFSTVAGSGTPTAVAFGVSVDVSFRGYNGGLTVGGLASADSDVSIDLVSGNIILLPTNIAGNIEIRGVGNLTDNSGPNVIVNAAGLLNPDFISTATFNGSVTIDSINGLPGTEFPLGNSTNPVNNLEDARAVADSRNLRRYAIFNPLTISGVHNNWTFQGEADHPSVFIAPGTDVDNSIFRNLTMSGTMLGESDLVSCIVLDMENYEGEMDNCAILGPLTLNSGSTTLSQCFSRVPGSVTDMIHAGAMATFVNVRHYSGGINFGGFTSAGSVASLDINPGNVILNSTNTNGVILVRGITTLTDNTGPNTTVITDGIVNVEEMSNAVWEKPTSPTVSGSFGEFVASKLLTVSKFLGLK